MTERAGWLLPCALLAGCGAYQPPPPHRTFDGLPISGSLSDAQLAGFGACSTDATSMRCRRHGVFLLGQGPFEAAVDLVPNDGSGGFGQLTLWGEGDQYAVYAIGDALERQGWRYCYTGVGDRGDQMVYTRAGASVRLSMDLSYWGKRRVRVLPGPTAPAGCAPVESRAFPSRR